MMHVTQQVATLKYRVGPRLGWTETWNPALPNAIGSTCSDHSHRPDAAAVARAADHFFTLHHACELWLHLADPVPAGHLVAAATHDALVASEDPEILLHVSGIGSSVDYRKHTRVRTRDLLAHILDDAVAPDASSDEPVTSAHELWVHHTTGRTPEPSAGWSVGPFSGWRLDPASDVQVMPLGRNNFRSGSGLRSIRDVVAGAGGTVAEWCAAHDALRGVAGANSPALDVAALLGLTDADRSLVADLFLDLVMWQAGSTRGRSGPHDPVEPLGPELLHLDDGRTWPIRSTRDNSSPLVLGPVSDAGLTITCDPASHGEVGGRPGLRITVPHDEIASLWRRFGVPAHAHPVPVLSLFADEILAKGPIEWLVSQGIEVWTATSLTDIRVVSKGTAPVTDSRFDKMISFHPTSGGHDAGLGLPGKSEFPTDWSRDTMHARIAATIDEPGLRTQIGHTVFDEREFDGVLVCCVWRRPMEGNARMLTAFPVCGEGVVVNTYPADYPADLVTSVAQALPELIAGGDREAVRLVANAAAVGEPYEAVQSGMWVALRDGIALPEEYMLAIGTMIHNKFFAAEDEDEVTEVFNALARRDHPEATAWSQQ